MKLKTILPALALLLCRLTATAQETAAGVTFTEGKTFSEALAQAKTQGRMLFVDCHTSWCGPCRMMSTKVFPQKTVGDFFNSKFVNIKIDMEKGEGPALAKRFGVRAYPTFLFLDADGKEVNRIVGAEADASKFLTMVKDGLGKKSLAAMTQRYDGGERDTTFLLDYIDVLGNAYNNSKSEEVAGVLLNGHETYMLKNPRLYNAFLSYNKSPLTPAFSYVLAHKDDFYARYDKTRLDRAIGMTWMMYPRTLLKKNADGTATFDRAAMDSYVDVMKKNKVDNIDEIVLMSDINVAEATGRWTDFATLYSKYIKNYPANDMYIYNWALRIDKNSTDRAVRNKAAGWLKARMKALEVAKAKEEPLKPGQMRAIPLVDFSTSYKKLLEKLTK